MEQSENNNNTNPNVPNKLSETSVLSYEQYIEKGDKYYKTAIQFQAKYVTHPIEESTLGSIELLEKAEYAYAEALRIADREKDLPKQAIIMLKIGNVYFEYGKHDGKGEHFTKAIALYNAAMARCEGNTSLVNELLGYTKEAEFFFLQQLAKKSADPSLVSYLSSDQEHKEFLKKLRNYCKEKLEELNKTCNPSLEENDAKREQLYRQRAEEIQKLYHHIAEEMKDFIRILLQECKDVLGEPPCKYAVLGLGSMAHEEMTPYSDFEWAILIEDDKEENKQYFHHLATLLHIKVINLGETILPSMSIKSLNDHYAEDKSKDWYYDDITPRGFSFDGAMPWASKTPEGRHATKNKPWEVELIGTPEKLAQYQSIEYDMKEGYHLATILAVSTLVEGEEALWSGYREKVSLLLHQHAEQVQQSDISSSKQEENSFLTLGQSRALVYLEQDLQQYAPDFGELSEQGKLYKVKKEIYRLPNTLLDGLALYVGLTTTVGWSRIRELEQQGKITPEAGQNLQVILSIATELRLRTYLHSNGQRESIAILPALYTAIPEEQEKQLQALFCLTVEEKGEKGQLFRFYATAFPLHEQLSKLTHTRLGNTLFARQTLYDLNLVTQANIHRRLLQYSQAKLCYEQWLSANPTDALVLDRLGEVLYRLGGFQASKEKMEEALQIWEKQLGRNHPNVVTVLNNLGGIYGVLGDTSKAIMYLEEVLQIREKLLGRNHPEMAPAHNNLGETYRISGDNYKAIQHYEEALQIWEKQLGRNHPNVTTTLNNLGLAHKELGNYPKAIKYLKEMLQIDEKIFGRNHPGIALGLNNIGLVYHALKDNLNAIQYLKKALQIWEKQLGRNHPNVVTVLNNLGHAYYALKDRTIAIQYLKEALLINRKLLGSDHPNVANMLNNLGVIYDGLGERKQAITSFQEAYSIYLNMLGPTHPDTQRVKEFLEQISNVKASSVKKPYHPNVAMDLANLRTLYRKTNNNIEDDEDSELKQAILLSQQHGAVKLDDKQDVSVPFSGMSQTDNSILTVSNSNSVVKWNDSRMPPPQMTISDLGEHIFNKFKLKPNKLELKNESYIITFNPNEARSKFDEIIKQAQSQLNKKVIVQYIKGITFSVTIPKRYIDDFRCFVTS